MDDENEHYVVSRTKYTHKVNCWGAFQQIENRFVFL